MSYRAIHRYAPMSARKARPVANMVKGLGVNEALEVLEYEPKRAASFLSKVLRSAIANAGQTGGVEAGQLLVKSAVVNDGPLKQGRLRWRPAPQGRAMPIRKRTCHIEVVLDVAEPRGGRRSNKAADTESTGDSQE